MKTFELLFSDTNKKTVNADCLLSAQKMGHKEAVRNKTILIRALQVGDEMLVSKPKK